MLALAGADDAQGWEEVLHLLYSMRHRGLVYIVRILHPYLLYYDRAVYIQFQALLLGHLSSSGKALVCLPTAALATQALPMHRQIECDTLPGQSGEYIILRLKRRQQM